MMKEKASHTSCHVDWPLDDRYDDAEEMKYGRVIEYHGIWNMLRAHEAHEVEDASRSSGLICSQLHTTL